MAQYPKQQTLLSDSSLWSYDLMVLTPRPTKIHKMDYCSVPLSQGHM